MYEINVSKQAKDGKYHHLFATHKRSVVSKFDLEKVLPIIVVVFPEPEYNITVTYWESIGHPVNVKDVLKSIKK